MPVISNSVERIIRILLSLELFFVFLHLNAQIGVLQGVSLWVLTDICVLIKRLLFFFPLIEDREALGCVPFKTRSTGELVSVDLVLGLAEVNVVVIVAKVVFIASWTTRFKFHPNFEALYVKDVIAFARESFDPLQLLKFLETNIASSHAKISVPLQEHDSFDLSKVLIEVLNDFHLLLLGHPDELLARVYTSLH